MNQPKKDDVDISAALATVIGAIALPFVIALLALVMMFAVNVGVGSIVDAAGGHFGNINFVEALGLLALNMFVRGRTPKKDKN